MDTPQHRLTPDVLALLAGVLASMVWESASAQVSPPTSARAISNLVVPVAGTVQGGAEIVTLSGQARIMSTMVTDPDFGGPPSVVLSINLLNVFGVGQVTGAKYAATGEQRVLRLLRPSDRVDVTFPVSPIGARGIELIRPALLSFTLDFDAGNGQLRRARANISAPNLPGLSSGQ